MTLQQKLNSFEIPATRRDINNLDNVAWLIRNIQIKNQHNVLLPEVKKELIKIFNVKIKS